MDWSLEARQGIDLHWPGQESKMRRLYMRWHCEHSLHLHALAPYACDLSYVLLKPARARACTNSLLVHQITVFCAPHWKFVSLPFRHSNALASIASHGMLLGRYKSQSPPNYCSLSFKYRSSPRKRPSSRCGALLKPARTRQMTQEQRWVQKRECVFVCVCVCVCVCVFML